MSSNGHEDRKAEFRRKAVETADIHQGFHGAIEVCAEIYAIYGDEGIAKLRQSGLTGEALWDRYSRECGRDIQTFYDSL